MTRSRRQRLGGGIEILPPGPLVMARVDAPPAAVGNQREEGGDMADRRVPPAAREERLVPALVQDREPLHEGERQQTLSRNPRRPAAGRRERDAGRGRQDG